MEACLRPQVRGLVRLERREKLGLGARATRSRTSKSGPPSAREAWGPLSVGSGAQHRVRVALRDLWIPDSFVLSG